MDILPEKVVDWKRQKKWFVLIRIRKLVNGPESSNRLMSMVADSRIIW